MKHKILLSLMMTWIAVMGIHAQATVTGTVLEKYDTSSEPCIGVNVTFQNSQNRIVTGVTTDINGTYSLKVPENEKGLTLVFSYIGMKTIRIKYTGQTKVDVTMESDAHEIQEVTVQGNRNSRNMMGVSERQMAFATQKVDMKELTAVQPVTSIEEALQGHLGGVDIIAAGDPGAKSNIRIRGIATLNGNADPLIVIDGVPYNTTIDDSFDFNTASQEDFAQMLNLNPNDIESIEVLKDAASTAIYGTQGANGVLLITKKKGAMGKTRFTFSTKNSLKTEPESMPMLNGNEYVAFIQDAIWNAANARGLATQSALLEYLFDTPEINYNQNWRYFDEYNQNVNWLDYVRSDAFTTDNSFSMSGGGERATYRYSLAYANEGGTTKGTGLGRLTTSLDIGYKFSDKFHVRAEYSYTDTRKDEPWSSSVRAEALRKMPNKSPYFIDDATGQMTSTYFTRQNAEEFQGAFTGSKNFHPIIMAKESFSKSSIKEQKITVRPAFYATPHLTYRGYVSMRFNTTKVNKFLPQSATGVTIDNTYANQASDSYTNSFSLQTENQLMYSNEWLDKTHQLTVTGLWRTSLSRSSNYSATRYNVASAAISDPGSGGGSLLSQGSGTSEGHSLSGLGSIVYTLLDRYTVNGTFNYEGRSALGKQNRWAFFPSVGVSWQLGDEPFMKWTDEWLDMWKIRVSYGMSGKAPSGTSPYVGTYAAIGNYMDGTAVTANKMQLNDLKWETSSEINLGTNIELFDGRLNASFDYYHKKTKDLLQSNYSIPAYTGYPLSGGVVKLKYFNSGKLENKGWEFNVDYAIIKSKDWNFKVNWNISRNINSITELPANLNAENYTFNNGNYATRIIPGTAVGSFFGFRSKGVYQNTEDTYAKDAEGNVMTDLQGKPIVMKNGTYVCYPGDAKYEDIDHNGVIDKNDIVYLGNANPIVSGGAGFDLKYKGLALKVFMHYRLGQKVINNARMNAESMRGSDNQSKAVLRRWRNEGDITDVPRALWGWGYNYLGSDRFVEDCSFVRIKTISLSYAFPKKLCTSLGMTNISMFVTGYDLFTFSNYTGQDPEVNLPSGMTDLATDNAQTPRAKKFAMGLTLNF